MTFSNYYLQWLIDYFGFVIEDVGMMSTFTKHDRFLSFVDKMRVERVQAELAGEKGKGLSCKNAVNGSYGYDIMNEMNFVELKYCDQKQILEKHRKAELVGETKISEEFYDKYGDKFLPRREPYESEEETKLDAKKLLGCCFEHSGETMICLAPKCYCLYGGEKEKKASKGYAIKKGSSVTRNTYLEVLEGTNAKDTNTQLKFDTKDGTSVTS